MPANDKRAWCLEERLYAALVPGRPPVKVARLIYDAFSLEEEWPDRVDIDEALGLLISRDDVVAFGNVKNWRNSEIGRRLIEP